MASAIHASSFGSFLISFGFGFNAIIVRIPLGVIGNDGGDDNLPVTTADWLVSGNTIDAPTIDAPITLGGGINLCHWWIWHRHGGLPSALPSKYSQSSSIYTPHCLGHQQPQAPE
jgi:hypothetical protein